MQTKLQILLNNIPNNEAYIILDEYNRRFILNFNSSFGVVCLLQNRIYFFVDDRYLALAKQVIDANIKVMRYEGSEKIIELLKSEGVQVIGLDYNSVSVKEYNEYKKLIKKRPIDIHKKIYNLRSVKNNKEQLNVQKANSITYQTYEKVLGYIYEGITEIELKSYIQKTFLELGAEGEAFDTIVAFNKNSAIPHYQSANVKLENESVVLIDMGAKYNGYCADCTRTFYYGNAPSESFITNYYNVLKAHKIGVKNAKENRSYKSADGKVRQYFKSENLEEYFIHSLGHGVGLLIHEEPYISQKGKGKFKRGEVFTIEPGLYFENEYGIRIEDSFYIDSLGQAKSYYSDSKNLVAVQNGKKTEILR